MREILINFIQNMLYNFNLDIIPKLYKVFVNFVILKIK